MKWNEMCFDVMNHIVVNGERNPKNKIETYRPKRPD